MKQCLPDEADIEILDMMSPVDGQARLACFKQGALAGLLFTAQTPVEVSRDWACAQLGSQPQGMARHRLLRGVPAQICRIKALSSVPV